MTGYFADNTRLPIIRRVLHARLIDAPLRRAQRRHIEDRQLENARRFIDLDGDAPDQHRSARFRDRDASGGGV